MTVVWNSSALPGGGSGSTDGIRIETVEGSERRVYFACKRLLDALGSLALLPALAPVFLLIAAAIKIDDRGPVLYRQERVGARRKRLNGRLVWEIETFRIFKFRSMIQN